MRIKIQLLAILVLAVFFLLPKIRSSGAYLSDDVTIAGISITTGTWETTSPTPEATPTLTPEATPTDVATPTPTEEPTVTPEATPTPTASPAEEPTPTP
jgi:outer membrane biosynthesis protein TonB